MDAAVQGKADALWDIGDPILNNPAQRIPDLAARAKLPSMYLIGEQVVAGGHEIFIARAEPAASRWAQRGTNTARTSRETSRKIATVR